MTDRTRLVATNLVDRITDLMRHLGDAAEGPVAIITVRPELDQAFRAACKNLGRLGVVLRGEVDRHRLAGLKLARVLVDDWHDARASLTWWHLVSARLRVPGADTELAPIHDRAEVPE